MLHHNHRSQTLVGLAVFQSETHYMGRDTSVGPLDIERSGIVAVVAPLEVGTDQ
jgi:hypothetical protein